MSSAPAAIPARVGFAEMPALLPQLGALARSGSIDLAGVQHVDSAGLAFLLELLRRSRHARQPLQLVGLTGQPLALARFFGVDGLLQHVPSKNPPAMSVPAKTELDPS